MWKVLLFAAKAQKHMNKLRDGIDYLNEFYAQVMYEWAVKLGKVFVTGFVLL